MLTADLHMQRGVLALVLREDPDVLTLPALAGPGTREPAQPHHGRGARPRPSRAERCDEVGAARRGHN